MSSTQKSLTRKNMPPDDPGRTPYTNEAVPYEEVDEIIERTWLNYQSVENALIESWKWIDEQKNNAWLHPKNVLVDISSSDSSSKSSKSSGSSSSSSKSSKDSSDSSDSSKSGSSSPSDSNSASSSTSSNSSSSKSSSSQNSPETKRPRVVEDSSSDDGDEPTPGRHLWPDSEDEGLPDYENENFEEPFVEDPKHSIFNRKYMVDKYEEYAKNWLDNLVLRIQEKRMKWEASDVVRLLHTRRISLKMRKYMYELKDLIIPHWRVALEIGNDYISIVVTFATINDKIQWVLEVEYWRKGIDKGRWNSKTDYDGEILKDHPHFDNDSKDTGPVQDLIFLCRKAPKGITPDLFLMKASDCEPAELNQHTIFEKLNRMVRASGEKLKVKKLKFWVKGFERSQGYDNAILRKVLKNLEPKILQKLVVRNFEDRPRELGDFLFLPCVVKTMQFQSLHTLDIQFDKVLHNWEVYRRIYHIMVWRLNVKDMEDIIDVWCAKPIRRGQGNMIRTHEEINEYQFLIIARNHPKLICITDANHKTKTCRMYFQAKQGVVIGMAIFHYFIKMSIVWPENRNHHDFPDPLPSKVTGKKEPSAPGSSTSQSSKKSKKKKDKKKEKKKKSKKSRKTKGKR